MIGDHMLHIREFQREPHVQFIAPMMKAMEIHVIRWFSVSEDSDIQGMEWS